MAETDYNSISDQVVGSLSLSPLSSQDVAESPPINCFLGYSSPEMACPVHGSVIGTIGFTFDGETETFCLQCLRDLLRRLLPQIDNESTRISVAPSVSGTRRSRYDLLKKKHK
jgi:hypothetical protein